MRVEIIKDIDVDNLVKAYLDVFNHEPWNDNISEFEVIEYFNNIIAMNTFRGYLCIVDEIVVGYCLGFIKPWAKGLEYYVDTFLIYNEFQSLGYGSGFIDCLKEVMKKENIKYILLDTEKDMPAYSFYLKNKFEELVGSVLMGINVEK